MLKGTRVDGVYTADPEKDPTAKKFNEISYKEVLDRGLRVTPVSPVFILGVELTMYIVYCSVSLAVLAVPAALFWHVRLRGSLLRFLGSRARCRRSSASSR